MARDLTSGMATELVAPVLRPVLFYEGVFTGGTLRLWSGIGPITWNSQTWTGAGNLIGLGDIVETTDNRAEGFTVSLSGVPTSLIAIALAQTRTSQAGQVWLGCVDAAGALVADPYLARAGRLDVPSIDDAGETCTIAITYENRYIDLRRARTRRWTQEDQHIDYPADNFFEFVPTLVDQSLIW